MMRALAEHVDTRQADDLAEFAGLVTWVRWASLAVGLALCGNGPDPLSRAAWGVALAVYALWRSRQPTAYRPGVTRDLVALVLDLTLPVEIVILTGGWKSPWTYCIAAGVLAAGFAFRTASGLVVAAASAITVTVSSSLLSGQADLGRAGPWTFQFVLVVLISTYTRRLFGEASKRTTTALADLSQLRTANQLLSDLHRVTTSLPVSLELTETAESIGRQVRDLLAPDLVAILLPADGATVWSVTLDQGGNLPVRLSAAELPPAVRAAIEGTDRVAIQDLRKGRTGLAPTSSTGAYARLTARGAAAGILAVEWRGQPADTPDVAGVLDAIADHAALALDNARWFARLCKLGADERAHIARDLHDTLGQNLAYLGIELERLERRAGESELHAELSRLRGAVRDMIGELRGTLHHLRADVSEHRDLPATLKDMARRIEERSGLRVCVESVADRRLPPLREREVWQVAREAIVNAARHAGAQTVAVSWRCDADGFRLAVADDGAGFDPGAAGGAPGGLDAMRASADAIGARFELRSVPGRGTEVVCTGAAA